MAQAGPKGDQLGKVKKTVNKLAAEIKRLQKLLKKSASKRRGRRGA